MKSTRIFFLIALLFGSLFFIRCNTEDDITIPINPSTPTDVFNLDKVPEITLELTEEQWNLLLTNYDLNPKNETKVVAKYRYSLDGNTIELDSIGLKLRGNTSRRRPEGAIGQLHTSSNPDWHHCHFGVDFNKNIKTQRFQGLKKLNLKWFKDDATYVREIYCYDLFRRYGIWTAPRASYCRVSIKVEGDIAPAYYGVYVMLESVDEDFINYRKENWTQSIGFMWKGGWAGYQNADFVQTESIGVEEVDLNPSNSLYYTYDLKTRENELDGAKTQLISFINNLNSKTGSAFKTWISQQMDVDLFLKTYAVNIMVGMWDDYWVNGNNFYFYMAPDGKVYFIPYDYDNTLGTSMLMPNSGTQNPLNWGPASGRPLITKILAIPEYQTKFKTYIKELADSNNDYFDTTKSRNRIASWQFKIGPYISNDTGEDMLIEDKPAFWGNAPFYRLSSGNNFGGNSGPANYFSSRTSSIPW